MLAGRHGESGGGTAVAPVAAAATNAASPPPAASTKRHRSRATNFTRSSVSTNPVDLLETDDDISAYVLQSGFGGLNSSAKNDAIQRQTEAYIQVQHRITEREEAAHALLISANPLSLSIMASQLRMYRWRVTEAQQLTEATSILRELVIDVSKRGYRVRRNRAAPMGSSRYAFGRGKSTLYRKAAKELEKLPLGSETMASVTKAAQVAEEEEEASAMESARADSFNATDLQAPPPDTLPRLVIVDGFTHESFEDIARHLRYVSDEHGLEMILLLLLPRSPGEESASSSMQGCGVVVAPQYTVTAEDAYRYGYDLVLAHPFDHLVVEFLTSTFVSAVGRWRNDVRSKAAVGNYISLRSVLLGSIDMEALKQLVWSEDFDDGEVLELLGAQSLAVQGDIKRYGIAGRSLVNEQASNAAGGEPQPARRHGRRMNSASSSMPLPLGGSGADSPMDNSRDSIESLPSYIPRLRSRPASVTRSGVRLPATSQEREVPLAGFSGRRDVLGDIALSSPSGTMPRVGYVYGDGDGFQLEDESTANDRLLHGAIEAELNRLIAENEEKQQDIEAMQGELERTQRAMEILKKHQPRHGSLDGPVYNVARNEQSDSGSLVHLSKQQQIFILKERLETANERIVALMQDGHRGNPTLADRQTAGQRGGKQLGAGTKTVTAPQKVGGKSNVSLLKKSYMKYIASRERDLLSCHDHDAADDADFSMTDDGQLFTRSPESMRQQRQERETTDGVIASLQREVRYLQSHLDADHTEDSGAQVRTARSLQEAVERLSLQKKRIQQLEELRRMDQLLLKRRSSDLRTTPTSHTSSTQRPPSGRKQKSVKPRTTSLSVTKELSNSGLPPTAPPAKGKKKPAATQNDEAVDAEAQAQAEALEATVVQRVNAAVAKVEKHHQQQLQLLMKSCRDKLNRVYLLLRKPNTPAYKRLVVERLAQASRDERGAWMRLRFAISSADPDPISAAATASGSPSNVTMVDLSSVKDPATRASIVALSREYATFSMRVEEAKAEVQRLEEVSLASREQTESLQRQRAEAEAAVMDASMNTGKGSVLAYIESTQRLLRVEDQLSQWGDVDLEGVLLRSATVSLPVLLPTVMHHKGSGGHNGGEDATGDGSEKAAEDDPAVSPVCMADQRSELREVLNVYTSLLPFVGQAATSVTTATSRRSLSTTTAAAAAARKTGPAQGRRRHHADEEGGAKRGKKGAVVAGSSRGRGSPSRARRRRGGGGGHHLSPRRCPAGDEEDHSGRERRGDGTARRKRRDVDGSGSDDDHYEEEEEEDYYDDGEDDAVFASSEQPRVELPIAPQDVSLYEGSLRRLTSSAKPYSPAHLQLYQLALLMYQQHQLHPDRMVDIEASVNRHETADNDRHHHRHHHGGVDDDEEIVFSLAYAQHNEVVSLVQLLAPSLPSLQGIVNFLVATQPLLHDEALERRQVRSGERADNAEDEEEQRGDTPASFLQSMNAALLTTVVDALRLRAMQHQEALPGPPSEMMTLFREETLTNIEASDPRAADFYSLFCSKQEEIATAISSAKQRGATTPSSAGGEKDLFVLGSGENLVDTDFPLPLPPSLGYGRGRVPGGGFGIDETDPGVAVAEELAAYFTQRRSPRGTMTGSDGGGRTLEEIYMDDDNDPATQDDNVRMMRSIRMELEYLQALKKQRMEELALRFELRQRQRGLTSPSAQRGRGNSTSLGQTGGSVEPWSLPGTASDAADVEGRIHFEVKGGSPAWYGMAASKRVRDILRRRARPDQVVVGGGPHGGGVGIELSRRTAFPRPPPMPVDVTPTASQRLRAAHMPLPPVRTHGLSRWQLQRYGGRNIPDGSGASGARVDALNAWARDAAGGEDLFSYVSPRDEASLNAYGQVLSSFLFDGANEYLSYIPPELTRLILNYRSSLVKASNHAGVPFYLPIQTSSQAHSDTPSARSTARQPLPELTTTVYGLPPGELATLLSQPPTPGAPLDTVVVLPRSDHVGTAGRSGFQQTRPSATFMTPAAAAARRLQAMLTASIQDPSVSGAAFRDQVRGTAYPRTMRTAPVPRAAPATKRETPSEAGHSSSDSEDNA